MIPTWKIKADIRDVILKHLEDQVSADEYNEICNNIVNDLYTEIDKGIKQYFIKYLEELIEVNEVWE